MPSSKRTRSVKRALDVTLAACGLIAFAPLVAAAAIAIWLTMGPPVLFRQSRPGLGGQPFTIMKFRSMSDMTDPEGGLMPEADRQTALGRWMRKTSFDELPELVNVIRGEMSIVGPRPLLMRYLPLYNEEQMRRHDVRPGITGLAQIRGRHTVPWETRFELDTWYVDHWSLRLDALILRETLKVLFRGQARFEHGRSSVPFTWTGNVEGRRDPMAGHDLGAHTCSEDA